MSDTLYMVRGIFTAASGMVAQEHRLDALANNLANADTVGYKRDVSVQKAFPEMLLRRSNDGGTVRFPLRSDAVGSIDPAPVVGRLGTGVEQNEVFTIFEQGSVQQTESPFDFALEGDGFFVVQTPTGERLTRGGSFSLGPEGLLVTQQGWPVLGEDGEPIQLQLNNFSVDQEGRIFANQRFLDDPNRLVEMRENEWDQTVQIGQLRIAGVEEPRYLQKQGNNLYRATEESGPMESLLGAERPVVLHGFVEKSNINVVVEMTQMIEVNRAYEANQKVIQSHDQATGRLIQEIMRAQ